MEDQRDWATPTLKEAPFWRNGMTPEEYNEENDYLYEHYDDFLAGSYLSLWAQRELPH